MKTTNLFKNIKNSTTSIKNIFQKIIFMVFIFISIVSCDKIGEDDNTDTEIPVGERETVILKGDITTNTTLSVNKKYLINGFVYVKNGAVLTIEPGTIIKGDNVTKGTLIVSPGAKIIAEGTASKPIVFTSNKPKGERNAGDWGGIIILGNAVVNKNPITIEGENISTFGGTNDADNSGILKYVRIEYAGIAFETDKEINGLTLGGVGKGTTIDYVQVSYSGDDGFEWFGGNVNSKHLVSYATLDDDFDTDNGFSGNNQYLLALRDPKTADQCSCSDSNLMESDNDGSGSTASPITSAKFANVTMLFMNGEINKKYRSAFRIRRNSAISIFNSVVFGAFPKAGLELEGTASQANFKNKISNYAGLSIGGVSTPILNVDETIFNDVLNKNILTITKQDMGFNDSFYEFLSPKFLANSSAKAIANGATLPAGLDATSYRGAFDGTNDWTTGWTSFNPQNVEY